MNLQRNAHIPWITIRFGSISLTWRGDENRPDYFTSLTHKRMVDKANVLTVNITYCPHVGEDPNKIEKAIYDSMGTCLVQYGDYASNRSKTYKASITSYTVDLENGVLIYSFTLMSCAVGYNLTPYSHSYLDSDKGENRMIIFTRILRKAATLMSANYDFEDPWTVLSTAKKFTGNVPLDSIGLVSPVKFIQEALKLVTPQEPGTYYALEIDDSYTGKGVMRVVHVDPSKATFSRQFEWGTKNGTVISWTPKFDGAIRLQEYVETAKSQNNVTVVSQIDPLTGDIITVKSTGKLVTDYTSADSRLFVGSLIKSDEEFKKYADYAYRASLTVLGESQSAYIGSTVINVVPLIMGRPHHSAGNYIVVGVTDHVDSSQGFTTSYELQKRVDTNSQDLYSAEKAKEDNMLWANGSFISYDQYNFS